MKIASMVHTYYPDAVQCYVFNNDKCNRRAVDYPDVGNKFPKHSDKFPGPKKFNDFMKDCGNNARLTSLCASVL